MAKIPRKSPYETDFTSKWGRIVLLRVLRVDALENGRGLLTGKRDFAIINS